MATTTNYGWTTPDDTSLVKDGAAAIRTLGSSIDTSLNTALGTRKAGMVLLNTTSFSGVATQSVNDVFSATYDNYFIVFNNLTGSAGGLGSIRLRTSGTDASGANYNRQLLRATGTSVVAQRNTGQTSFEACFRYDATNTKTISNISIQSPFIAANTTMSVNDNEGGFGTGIIWFGALFNHALTTSYSGFTIIAEGVTTLTGSVSTYGLNK